ncbi:MAG: hypothetical protein L3K13_02410 [Thermoplasmata archaeon]|nr:hypothetical protein [Thermoplasmata archaeon]
MATAPAEGEPTPPPRRDSWSLRTIVEEVAGQPLEAFQDPARAPHPYVHLKTTHAAASKPRDEPEFDPVAHVYPPLVGEVGRQLHGPADEHHRETLEALEGLSPRNPERPPGPSRRPERIYLHYLLLHLDRLSDRALEYLRASVREELAHRASAATEPPPPPPSF